MAAIPGGTMKRVCTRFQSADSRTERVAYNHSTTFPSWSHVETQRVAPPLWIFTHASSSNKSPGATGRRSATWKLQSRSPRCSMRTACFPPCVVSESSVSSPAPGSRDQNEPQPASPASKSPFTNDAAGKAGDDSTTNNRVKRNSRGRFTLLFRTSNGGGQPFEPRNARPG